jgi:hypothetical protein
VYECEKRGLQMPFIIVGVGINGSVMVLGHSLDDDADGMESRAESKPRGASASVRPFHFSPIRTKRRGR